MSDTHFDVVLYGATGFTGRQAVAYFQQHAPAGLRWAVAGRSREKLEALAMAHGATGVIVADSGQPATVEAMAARAGVLLTTAGPYSRYGTPVVEACVRHGVHYVDITGETPWVRGLIDAYDAEAARIGTRIVPFCGFDSVPSDLGVLAVVEHLRRTYDADTRSVSASYTVRGGFNGGTAASMMTLADTDPGGRLLNDVLLLNPADRQSEAERARSADLRGVHYDALRKVWLAPFLMAAVNTRVVRRSNALFAGWDRPYGASFAYHEAHETKSRLKAYGIAAALGAVERALDRGPVRWLAGKLSPAPGEGPSEATMDGGFMRGRYLGEAESGQRVLATMKAKGDPGNRVTVKILCESALLLAGGVDALPGGAARGGVLTPATAFGLPLLERLRAQGFDWQIEAI